MRTERWRDIEHTGGGGMGLWSRGAILVSSRVSGEWKSTHDEGEGAEAASSDKYDQEGDMEQKFRKSTIELGVTRKCL